MLTVTRDLKLPTAITIITTDCGFGRKGLSRRIAYYKCVALVRGTNIIRKEIGAPEAECLAADPKYSFIRTQ